MAVEDQWSFALQLQLISGGPSSESYVNADRKRWIVEAKSEQDQLFAHFLVLSFDLVNI